MLKRYIVTDALMLIAVPVGWLLMPWAMQIAFSHDYREHATTAGRSSCRRRAAVRVRLLEDSCRVDRPAEPARDLARDRGRAVHPAADRLRPRVVHRRAPATLSTAVFSPRLPSSWCRCDAGDGAGGSHERGCRPGSGHRRRRPGNPRAGGVRPFLRTVTSRARWSPRGAARTGGLSRRLAHCARRCATDRPPVSPLRRDADVVYTTGMLAARRRSLLGHAIRGEADRRPSLRARAAGAHAREPAEFQDERALSLPLRAARNAIVHRVAHVVTPSAYPPSWRAAGAHLRDGAPTSPPTRASCRAARRTLRLDDRRSCSRDASRRRSRFEFATAPRATRRRALRRGLRPERERLERWQPVSGRCRGPTC